MSQRDEEKMKWNIYILFGQPTLNSTFLFTCVKQISVQKYGLKKLTLRRTLTNLQIRPYIIHTMVNKLSHNKVTQLVKEYPKRRTRHSSDIHLHLVVTIYEISNHKQRWNIITQHIVSVIILYTRREFFRNFIKMELK